MISFSLIRCDTFLKITLGTFSTYLYHNRVFQELESPKKIHPFLPPLIFFFYLYSVIPIFEHLKVQHTWDVERNTNIFPKIVISPLPSPSPPQKFLKIQNFTLKPSKMFSCSLILCDTFLKFSLCIFSNHLYHKVQVSGLRPSRLAFFKNYPVQFR